MYWFSANQTTSALYRGHRIESKSNALHRPFILRVNCTRRRRSSQAPISGVESAATVPARSTPCSGRIYIKRARCSTQLLKRQHDPRQCQRRRSSVSRLGLPSYHTKSSPVLIPVLVPRTPISAPVRRTVLPLVHLYEARSRLKMPILEEICTNILSRGLIT